MTERTRTRRAFAAAELDERQRQRDSSPWLPPAPARTAFPLLSPASIALLWSLQTLFPRRTFSFQRESLRGMPRLSGSSRDHSPEGTAPSLFMGANASLTKHKFPLSLAPKRQRTLSATLVRRKCMSSSGQTEWPAAMSLIDPEATAFESSTCSPGTASLATTCHHAERVRHTI